MSELWHAYGGFDEEYFIVVAGPVADDTLRGDDNSEWDSSWFREGPYTQSPVVCDFLSSFDHEPTPDERIALVPEEHRAEFLASLADEDQREIVGFDDDVSEFHLSEDEQAALSLALSARAEILNLMYERFIVRGQSPRAVIACQEQIEALQSVWLKMGLEETVWEY